MFQKLPDDPEIENMDPIMKAWMFHSWVEDQNDEYKVLENQSLLIGSFINPELAKKVMGNDGETHTSTDEEFEKNWKETFEQKEIVQRKRRKRTIG